MITISLSCQCGEVKGHATGVSAASVTRSVCCCSDCQAFAKYLKREEDTLDAFGGTDLFILSQSQIKLDQGHDKLQSMRLTKKGMLRWYTHCCNTPVGNSMNAKMPFFSLILPFVDQPNPDAVLGPVRAYVQTQDAIGEPDYAKHSPKFPLGITVRIIRKMLVWKIKGMNKPSVFFGEDGRAVVKPIIAGEHPA